MSPSADAGPPVTADAGPPVTADGGPPVTAEGPATPDADGTRATADGADELAPGGSTASRRGFPGFPAGDPRQLPLAERPRGLDAPAPPGGRDPEIEETLRRERPYVRLLVGMVAVIVGGSLILTFLALISAAFLR